MTVNFYPTSGFNSSSFSFCWRILLL